MKKQPEKMVLPTQQRSIKSKEKILAAAESVFVQKGLHGARIDEISQLACVNKQRIYAYFGSKKKLYRQVLLKVYSLAATNEKIINLTEDDIPNMTLTIIESFFDFHQRHPQFWRLLAWENLYGGQSLKNEDWKSIRTSYICHIQKLYEAGQNKNCFNKSIDFSTYILTIFSVTYFYYSNQLTISHLLNLKLETKTVRQKIAEQLNEILTFNTSVQ
jgi:AcrR family transcriptional regulator